MPLPHVALRCLVLSLVALAGLATGPGFAADNVIPARRTGIVQNMDFFGADLTPLFETNYDFCQQVCLSNPECKAFTFNFKSNACFPKSGVSELKPHEGAVSARVYDTNPAILKEQGRRIGDLSFLSAYYLNEARQQAERLARDYVTNQWTAEQLVEASRTANASGNKLNAMKFMGASLNITDAPDGWVEMATLALEAAANDSQNRLNLQQVATSAAINGYLRGTNKALAVTALGVLAQALEARRSGRTAISALRLAQSIQPRLATDEALDRLIGLYGFRILKHTVDNNPATPRICATFSEQLVRSGIDYADYIRLPKPGLAVEASGDQICIEGVSHGDRVRLTFREGLPAASGETLAKSVNLNVYVKDRDPSVRFLSRAYILPKGEGASIPVVTVNLTEVALKIHRIGDRNLVRAIQQDYLSSPLSWWEENEITNTIGEEVWTGTGNVDLAVNQNVTTALPIGDAVKTFEPGIYVLSARVKGANVYTAASQWFVVTDLGLASAKGGDGLHVFVRSLNSADAVGGVAVKLVARNNDVLSEGVTDDNGYAVFAPGLLKGTGGNAPAVVTAMTGDDYAFLPLTDPAFDLSDRGVEGRPSPPPIDVFLATDRGAYRAGETVYATALARDERAEALSGLPLTAIVTRPDGVEFTRELLDDKGAGGRVFAIALPRSAQRGTWNIRVHADPDDTAVVSGKFLVEDIIPDRIEFDLSMQDELVRLDDSPRVSVDARYLYGAPGAGLKAEAEVRVMAAAGLDGYPGFAFGRADEYVGLGLDYTNGDLVTDSDGKLDFQLAMPGMSDVSRPLKMVALVRLSEGSGRPVERAIEKNLAPSDTVLGIKPQFEDVVPEGTSARFDLVAVGTDLARVNVPGVKWTLNRVRTLYQWYQSSGSWNWEPITTRTRVTDGVVDLGTAGFTAIEAPVDWGHYELKVETTEGEYRSSTYDFWAGWYAPVEAGDSPDVLELSLDADRYKAGDTARLRVVPRYAGKALVTVMSNHLIDMKTVDVTEGENLIDLDVTDAWGAGAYVTATVIRPMDVAAGHNPARSIGLDWAGVDPGDHQLQVAILTDNETQPRATMTASLQVDGVRPGDTAWATIAAVDVGILNLTGYKAPDPSDHYFGQRKLGMDLRDLYGRLIDGMQGAPGQVRSGGDGALADRLNSPPPTEDLVTFFSGPVVVGADGTVEVDFDIPEFNGTLRVMAIVWSETGVGQASKDVLIRDPIVLTASLPRFLAPGDESRMLLEIAHAKGPTGQVGVAVAATGGLVLDTSAIPAQVTLGEGERVAFSLPISAPLAGDTELTVVITTPEGKRLTKDLRLPVRALDPEIARTARVELGDGKTFRLSDDVFSHLLPGTGRAVLAVGPLARFDAPGLLSALVRYPYGCTEQITSKALPLLYFEPVARALDLPGAKDVATRIDQAITEVLSNQSSNGSFGLWRPGSGDLWLDSYVSDFLSRARAKGYAVPDQAFRLAIDSLRNRVNYAADFENGGEDIAYALMVLAREGGANIGDLRYYADTKFDDFATPLALAQIGAALAYYGDQTRADTMFRKAGAWLDRDKAKAETQLWRADYGTNLRDTAAVLTLAVEAGSAVLDNMALARRITPTETVNRWRSTQENMWSLMAANALIEETRPDDFLIDDQPVDGPLVRVLDSANGITGPVDVTNQSGRSVDTVLTTYGIPAEPEPASGNGYSIDRFYFTLDGKPVTPDRVKLNERLLVLLKITPHGRSEGRLIVNDPLPAGLEIDNPNLLKSGDVSALDWLDLTLEPQNAEFRAERFVAAVDWRSEKSFQLAYIVRAISPGRFHHPAASVEDMYRPQFRARTGIGRVEVTE